MAASAWVAPAALCLRTSSMTFATASASACEVEEVAATAACGDTLRMGGKAACWRGAGVNRAGRAGTLAAGASNLTGVAARITTVPAAVVVLEGGAADACGAVLRPLGRGLGNGTACLAQASAENAKNAAPSAKPVANAVDRKAAERLAEITAFPGEKSLWTEQQVYLIEYADKILKNWVMGCLRQHRGKITAGPAEASSSVPRPFRLIVRPDMNQVAKE